MGVNFYMMSWVEGLNIDIEHFIGVNIVADAHKLPIQSKVFDVVMMKNVLEHVRNPEIVVREAKRILKKGGFVYSEIPQITIFYTPTDFTRWTLMGLNESFNEFQLVKSGIDAGPGSAMARIIPEFIAVFSETKCLHYLLRFVAGYLSFWLKYLDIFLNDKKYAHRVSCDLYYIGKKI